MFYGVDCVTIALDFCIKLKGEEGKTKNKTDEYNLQLHAHNGSGFDTLIKLNNLSCGKHIAIIIKNGKAKIELKIFNGYLEYFKKQIPQNIHFRCGMTLLNYSVKKLGRTFKLQKEMIKTEMNHDEVDGNNCKDEKDEWLDDVKQDVLCMVFSYARYCTAKQEITGFGMKDCLSLPGLGWKYFESSRTEEDEPIYTYEDKYIRYFVTQNIKGGRVCAFNQYCKYKFCDDFLRIISEELNVKGMFYDNIEAYLNYKNKQLKIFEKEYENQFNDYRDEDVEEKEKFTNKKLSQLTIHQIIEQTKLDELLWDYDANSLYPSAMWDEKSIYLRNETGYAYTTDMNDELIEKIKTGNFNQGSGILKIKYYKPKNLTFQYIPVKEREKKIEDYRMRNGYIL